MQKNMKKANFSTKINSATSGSRIYLEASILDFSQNYLLELQVYKSFASFINRKSGSFFVASFEYF
jgi:hypothetical protein